MEARVLLGKKGITLLAILWLFAAFSGEFGCSKKVNVSQPEDFKYLEGTLVHLHKKILVVKSDDEQKVCFRAGRRTVFTPKAWPNIGDRLWVRYHSRVLSHKAIGDYFIAYEVRKLTISEKIFKQTRVETDDYGKLTLVIGPSMEISTSPEYELCFAYLKGIVTSSQFQLIVTCHAQDWSFFGQAHDRDGEKLESVEIDRQVETRRYRSKLRSGWYESSRHETFGIMLSREYLEKASNQGIDIKVIGKKGERIIRLPAFYIEGFLKRVKRFFKPLK